MNNDQAAKEAAELLDEVLALRTPDFHETLMAAVAAKLRERDKNNGYAITSYEARIAELEAEVARLNKQLDGGL